MKIPTVTTYHRISVGLVLAAVLTYISIHLINMFTISHETLNPAAVRQASLTGSLSSFVAVLCCGILCAAFLPRAVFRPAAMGLSLAYFCFALGLLYKIALSLIRPEQIPFISFLGYCGFFLLLLGVVGLLRKLDEHETRARKVHALAFLATLIPLLSGFTAWWLLFSEIQVLLASLLLFYGLTLWRLPHYRSFLQGIFLIVAVVLLNQIVESSWTNGLLPTAITLCLPGFIRNNGDEL